VTTLRVLTGRLERAIEYEILGSRSGLEVHFITAPFLSGTWLSLAMTSDFGSIHTEVAEAAGRVTLPMGTAHLVEHLLFFGQRNHVSALQRASLEVNARVDADRTVWWLRMADLSRVGGKNRIFDTKRASEALRRHTQATAVEHMLSIIFEPISKGRLSGLVVDMKVDVESEIRARASAARRLERGLFRALYPAHPLGMDPLGTIDSFQLISQKEIEAALWALRSELSSIAVLTPIEISGLKDAILEAATYAKGLKATASTAVCPPVGRVPVPMSSDVLENQGAYVAIGCRLPPLSSAFPDRHQRARMLVASFLVQSQPRSPVGCLLGSTSRTYLAEQGPMEPWWFERDVRRDFLRTARSTLRSLKPSLDLRVEMALTDVVDRPHGLLQLCQVALMNELNLEEVLTESKRLSEQDIDVLTAELEWPVECAQYYLGPEMELL
jgi:hypothetical protein